MKILTMLLTSALLFDFQDGINSKNWRVVDDVVMGGRSSGRFYVNGEGNGVFEGTVSLENNGGFSSVQKEFDPVETSNYNSFVLRVKGDGKAYQFRVKSIQNQYYSYIGEFNTSSEWEEIIIPFHTMYPAFRGRKLNLKNFPGQQVVEATFLIANKKAESFRLEIDQVILR